MKALLTSFDLLLVAAAFLIMAVGLARRWSLWRKKKPAGISGDWHGLKTALLAQRDILKRPSVGGAHLAAFWGVVIPLIVIILAQFGFIIPHAPANLLSSDSGSGRHRAVDRHAAVVGSSLGMLRMPRGPRAPCCP